MPCCGCLAELWEWPSFIHNLQVLKRPAFLFVLVVSGSASVAGICVGEGPHCGMLTALVSIGYQYAAVSNDLGTVVAPGMLA